MVLDPIEPVAPRIVTPRTAAGLDFGRVPFGIKSPNEAGRAPALPGRRGCRPTMTAAAAAVKNPSSRSITPPWPGMMLARILGAEVPLDRGFEQIAGLRYHRQKPAPQGPALARPTSPSELHRQERRHDAAERAADGPGPGLLRANRGPELRPAERPPGEIGRDIGDPHDREQEQRSPQSRAPDRGAG